VNYNFEWDQKKATRNYSKHKISFELDATIFLDPNTITIYDSAHSEIEDRWIKIGFSRNRSILTTVHKLKGIDDFNNRIRII